MDAAVVITRLVAYASAVTLFGAPLFFLYSLPAELQARPAPTVRPAVIIAALLSFASAAAGLVLQTGVMAGDASAGLDPATLRDVLIGGGFGVSIIVRLASAGLALITAALVRAGARLWIILSGMGAFALSALAWDGHGAADPGLAGALHAAADVGHLLAAGVWLGALVALCLLLTHRTSELTRMTALHRALEGFSGVGLTVVAVIIATGLINSWFLVGPHRIPQLLTTTYGRLLVLKLVIFVAMLGFAALNRFRLTPALERALGADHGPALASLRRSIIMETLAGLAVLILVAWLGTLEPISAA